MPFGMSTLGGSRGYGTTGNVSGNTSTPWGAALAGMGYGPGNPYTYGNYQYTPTGNDLRFAGPAPMPQQGAQLRPGASRMDPSSQPPQQFPQMPQMPLMPQGPFGNAGRFGGMYQNPQMSPAGGQQMLPNMMGAFFGAGGLRGY